MWNDHLISFLRSAIIVVGLWLGMSLFLDATSGWRRLHRGYPEVKEPQLLRLGGESGWVGGMQMRGGLILSAGPTGLRLAMSPILAPLARPCTIPWSAIYAQHVPGVFGAKAQLSFQGDVGSIRISAKSWEALVAFAGGRPAYDERRDHLPI